MRTHHKTFLRRAVVIPAIFGVTLGATVSYFDNEAPTATAQPADPIVMAEQTVNQKAAELTAGRDCYEDPTGREPATAVVKPVGTTTVRTLTADAAWTAAHDGDVWVLAWCDEDGI